MLGAPKRGPAAQRSRPSTAPGRAAARFIVSLVAQACMDADPQVPHSNPSSLILNDGHYTTAPDTQQIPGEWDQFSGMSGNE